MRERQYIEGAKGQENFEEGMKAIFKVPKEQVVKAEKKRKSRAPSLRKPKRADRD